MTKKIICSGGEEILVDDEDYPVLARHKWHYTPNGTKTRYYAVTRLNMSDRGVRTIFMHSMIIGFALNVDHRDNNTKNNKKTNIRKATMQQNNINKPGFTTRMGKPVSSKYKGVQKSGKRWRATLGYNRKNLQLGTHDTEEQAALAYNKKAKELYGEFAWLNQIPKLKTSNNKDAGK